MHYLQGNSKKKLEKHIEDDMHISGTDNSEAHNAIITNSWYNIALYKIMSMMDKQLLTLFLLITLSK